jgi:spore coat polysaccharide biosynthesis protein SpsF
MIVATSTEKTDDAIEWFCAQEGVACFRGPLNDVAERFSQAASHFSADAFVRISGDSPLIAPQLIDQAVALYHGSNVELATNVMVRSFPKGMSVEVVRTSALRRAQSMMLEGEAEHVTQVFYRRPSDFSIGDFSSGQNWGEVQLSIDTPEDFVAIERVVAAAGRSLPDCGISELVALKRSDKVTVRG